MDIKPLSLFLQIQGLFIYTIIALYFTLLFAVHAGACGRQDCWGYHEGWRFV